jgi:hypothetical protein
MNTKCSAGNCWWNICRCGDLVFHSKAKRQNHVLIQLSNILILFALWINSLGQLLISITVTVYTLWKGKYLEVQSGAKVTWHSTFFLRVAFGVKWVFLHLQASVLLASGNTLDLYCRVIWFKSRPGHRQLWQFFTVFLSFSRQVYGWHFDYATAAYCETLYDLSFIKRPKIRCSDCNVGYWQRRLKPREMCYYTHTNN